MTTILATLIAFPTRIAQELHSLPFGMKVLVFTGIVFPLLYTGFFLDKKDRI